MKNSLGNFNVKAPGRYLGTRVAIDDSVGDTVVTDVYYYDNLIVRNFNSASFGMEANVYNCGYKIEAVRRFINTALEQFGYKTRIELVPNSNIWRLSNGKSFEEGIVINE